MIGLFDKDIILLQPESIPLVFKQDGASVYTL